MQIKKSSFAFVLSAMLWCQSGFCAFDFPPAGGRALGMGHAMTAVGKGPEVLFYNPASVVRNDPICFFFSYLQPYGLKELASQMAVGMTKTPYGNLGFAFHHFGNAVYRENTFAVGSGFSFRNRLDWGMLVRILRLDISKYGHAEAVQFDTGFLLRFDEKTVGGASVSNVNRQKIGRRHDPLSQNIRTGIGWKPHEDVLCSAEIVKETFSPFEFKAGVEAQWMPGFTLRSGFENRPSFFTFGFGLARKTVSLDYGVSIHPVLGTTHAVSILLTP